MSSTPVVVVEALHVVLECIQPGRREDARLPPATAEPGAARGLGPVFGAAHDQRAHRSAQTLRQADRQRCADVAVRRQRGSRRHVCVPDAAPSQCSAMSLSSAIARSARNRASG